MVDWFPPATSASTPHLRLLCVNDVYKPERLSQFKTMSLANRALLASTTTKTVFPGDFLGGSVFAAGHTGASVVDVLNHLDIDYFTHGNHEYDFGAARVAELMDQSTFKWLGSNVRHAENKQLFHTTLDVDVFEVPVPSSSNGGGQQQRAVKVGVFGVCTDCTPSLADPGDTVVFEDPVAHAARCIALLRGPAHACDVVLGLTHVELPVDRKIAALPGIDVIVGGHEHEPFHFVSEGTRCTVIKCGQNIDHLGVLDLTFSFPADGAGGVRVQEALTMVPTAGVPRDPHVDAVIDKWVAALPSGGGDEALCCVGECAVSTLTRDLRARETSFACAVADALVWSYRARDRRCDLGVQNGGFVRCDNVYKPGTLLTKAMVLAEMPFARRPVLIDLSLRHLRLGLEQMLADAPAHVGSFPHLSAGWEVAVDVARPPLHRVVGMRFEGEELDVATGWGGAADGPADSAAALDRRRFHVAIQSFYVDKDGDGVDAFHRGALLGDHGQLVSDCVVDYLRTCVDALDGHPPGRLILLNADGAR